MSKVVRDCHANAALDRATRLTDDSAEERTASRLDSHVARRRCDLILVLSAIVLATVAALWLAACGSDGGDSSPAASSSGPNILHAASWTTMGTWDPRAASSGEPAFLLNVYEPLLYANPEGSASPSLRASQQRGRTRRTTSHGPFTFGRESSSTMGPPSTRPPRSPRLMT